MASKLKKAIGAVKDQTSIRLAKVSGNNSWNLDVAVLKATTHDDVPVDERYVYEVLHLVSANKVYAAACARAIGKRIGRTRNWVVALKSLMLVLRIFQDGDPYFPREVLHAMKRGAKILNLSSFRDDSHCSPWDFTSFVRTFALYLDERLDCFLTGKLQRRYTYRPETEDSVGRSKKVNVPVRELKPAMLLDRISYWQRLLERAIATRPTGAARTNGLVQKALYAVVLESFDLYKDVSDGLTLILDSFFHLQYQSCVIAFQTCMKAAKQFEELSAFYSLCKTMGVGRSSEYPSVHSISPELIETLQEFLKDQSSFPPPTSNRSGLLLWEPSTPSSARSIRHESKFELSSTSERWPERMSTEEHHSTQRCTSLEDLLIATAETNAKTGPPISIDLEAYSDQFEKQSFRLSDSGSTRSLPVSDSMADLLFLDDWKPDTDHQSREDNNDDSSKGWELVLAETITSSLSSKTFNEEQETPARGSSSGWELVLFETPPPHRSETLFDQNPLSLQPSNNLNRLSLDALYDQYPLPVSHHYNPFLEDEFPIIPTMVSPTAFPTHIFSPSSSSAPSPTFLATPTFSAQNPTETQYENDPFATFSDNNLGFTGPNMTQQNYLHEQQLWLQHQNKIIAKHMA
ncbi:PREDICTED: clathrin coat assembly protein AP180 [Ipomoea nil]|uniref:clathrin coat assembly protein AP180 n=1 Tax=Ipomoea nil TaxID=35883 RepID=UPI0009016F98|nr:PREDICTED: clathrin coat assembly protein AP180 [Ipomoea nil]